MRRWSASRLVFGCGLTLVLALAAAGCKQGVGERCEQNSDCSSGHCTELGPATPASANSVCVSGTGVILPPEDAGVAAPVDATIDVPTAAPADAAAE